MQSSGSSSSAPAAALPPAPMALPGRMVQPVTSAAVPVEWRQLYAVALYTGLRAGEPADASAPVAPLLSALKRGDDRVAMTFHAHLRTAKVDRARLEADNATEEPIAFRSLRDS